MIKEPTQYLGVRHIQDLFHHNAPRLNYGVEDQRVHGHNNRADRELRTTVLAQKTSFGAPGLRGNCSVPNPSSKSLPMAAFGTSPRESRDVIDVIHEASRLTPERGAAPAIQQARHRHPPIKGLAVSRGTASAGSEKDEDP